jgi:hypothetical protein
LSILRARGRRSRAASAEGATDEELAGPIDTANESSRGL